MSDEEDMLDEQLGEEEDLPAELAMDEAEAERLEAELDEAGAEEGEEEKGEEEEEEVWHYSTVTSNGSWCIGIKGEMSGTVCVTFTWDIYIYELFIAFVCFVVCSLL